MYGFSIFNSTFFFKIHFSQQQQFNFKKQLKYWTIKNLASKFFYLFITI